MSYADEYWFPARMMWDYADENLADTPHLEHLRRREEQIMKIVWANHIDGIHHGELAHKAGIDRKNLRPYMRRLMTKGLVTRNNGKQGKYYPATKENRDTLVTADILGEVVASTILEFYKCFPIDSPFFKNEILDDISPLDYALLMFSNGIGAIIIYIIIQSMNPSFDIPGRDAKNDQEKDINVNRWFRDAMSALRDILLPLFKQYMSGPLLISNKNYAKKNGTPNLNRAGIEFLRHIFSSPSYMYKEKDAASLIRSFSRTYPNISGYLEFVESRLTVGAFWETNHREYERISYWNKKKCIHDYRQPSNKSLAAKYGNNILHCRKCHRNKRLKSLTPSI